MLNNHPEQPICELRNYFVLGTPVFCACTNSRTTLIIFVHAQCIRYLATIRVLSLVRIESEKG